MKVALYARVSTEDQTLSQQLTSMRKYCDLQEWEIVAEYSEIVSGSKSDRPEFKRLFREFWNKGYKAIIVWKLDRFSRESLSKVLGYIEKLRRHNIGVISVSESWLDTRKDNPMKGVTYPVRPTPDKSKSKPTHLQQVHAEMLSNTPTSNNKRGEYRHTMPDFSTGKEIDEYIRKRYDQCFED